MIDVDPDRWLPSRDYAISGKPKVGNRVAWRYAIWLVVDEHITDEANWTEQEAAYLARIAPQHRAHSLPRTIVLQHECGPNLSGVPDGRQVHLHLDPWSGVMSLVAVRYQTCSCHGHPWPCIEYDRDCMIASQSRKTARLLAGAKPGVCAYCLEPVTGRQKTVTFPEPSLLVPGAPGPTFHAGRSDCWRGARDYETEHRLAAYPEATRLASCPGDVFIHCIGQTVECTAGPGCTGLHGPFRVRPGDGGTCATRVRSVKDLGHYARPLSDCGYRDHGSSCLGAETGPCEPLPPGVSDLFGRPQ
ncbi:hypothetical protein QQG74_09780 [Micromonospora sp. FIMYZ51]|uniref:hypothetical protein n=1 Tax=Micromonospora sp. FIMYZ51 TaxID=3051832 RepID=UPI00311E3D2B